MDGNIIIAGTGCCINLFRNQLIGNIDDENNNNYYHNIIIAVGPRRPVAVYFVFMCCGSPLAVFLRLARGAYIYICVFGSTSAHKIIILNSSGR